MYLWMVLGTFMVALLSFNLPVRPDADRQNNETKAQTVITKFRAQHNAFKRYIESKQVKLQEHNTNAEAGADDAVVYYSGLGYGPKEKVTDGKVLDPDNCGMLPSRVKGNNIPNTGFRNNIGVQKPFVADQELLEFKGHLPYGFKMEGDIFSKVYCFSNNTDVHYNYDRTCEQDTDFRLSDEERKNCCARPDVDVFVVSWEKMPARWVQQQPNWENAAARNLPPKPTADMMAAIAKSEGYGYNFGYVTYINNEEDSGKPVRETYTYVDQRGVERTLTRDIRIVSGGMYRTLKAMVDADGKPTGKYKELIQYRPIFDVLLDDTDFTSICALKTNNISNPCLIAINKVSNREEQ